MLEQCNHNYRRLRRVLAMVLCLAVLAGGIRFPSLADTKEAALPEGWQVQVSWSNLRTDYVWNAGSDELRQPKAVVTYRLENARRSYGPGTISVTLPGIGGSVRGETAQAAYHSGEDAEWDCAWDRLADRYTFTNRFTVKEGQSINGGFELMWTLQARDCVDGYHREESPVFAVADAGSVSLEPLSYRFRSQPDRYRIQMERDKLHTTDYENADKAYIWYSLVTRFDKDWLARGIYRSSYRVSVELENEDGYPDVAVRYQGKELPLERLEDGSMGFYLFRNRYGSLGDPDYTAYETFTIGFRRETLADSPVVIHGHLDRLYEDREEWTTTAGENEVVDQELSFQVEDYRFTHAGYLYDHDKWNFPYENYDKAPEHYWHQYGDEKTHQEPADYTDRFHAAGLYNGKLVEFALRGEAKRSYTAPAARAAAFSLLQATPADASVAEGDTEDGNPAVADSAVVLGSSPTQEKASHMPAGLEDWNDLHWKENRLTDVDGTSLEGLTYGELHPAFLASPSDAVSSGGASADASPSDASRSDGGGDLEDEEADAEDEEANAEGFWETDLEYDLGADLASPSNLPAKARALRSLSRSQSHPTKPGGNTGASQIKDGQEYALVLGDDQLAVYLKDGTLRRLEDEEYDFAYVTVPTNGIQAEYEIYGAATQDLHFDDYTLLAQGDTGSLREFVLPEGVKALFVRVNDLSGSCSFQLYVGARLHLDWESCQQQPEEERPDHENRLVNFSYFRALYVDEEGYETNDCAQTQENYLGSYGEALAGRDEEVYQELLLRDYSNVWLRSPVTALASQTKVEPFSGGGTGGFASTVTAAGTIQADNPGELSRFSLYAVLPDGLEPVLEEGLVSVEGSGTWSFGGTAGDFESQVSFRLGERDKKTMVAADFDFSGSPLEIGQRTEVQISFPVRLSYLDFAELGSQYRVDSYLMVHDDGLDKASGEAILSDEFDMDGDGRTDEKMAYSSDKQVLLDQAFQWREYVSKYVKSSYSDGYGTETAVRIFEENAPEEIRQKSNYAYRLDFGLGSSNAKEIVFYDRIEQGASVAEHEGTPDAYREIPSAWQGTFLEADTSYAEGMGLIPTVYYSTDENQELDLTAPGWEQERPKDASQVKAIAIHLDTGGLEDGVLKTRQMVSVTLRMQAPEDPRLIGKKAVNQYQVRYDAYGPGSGYEKTYDLPSSETYVRLLDTVGSLVLQKTDQDHPISTDSQGGTRYAALAGASFQIYDQAGTPLFEEPQKTDLTGRLEIRNVPYGTYYWEEVQAPEGYEPLPGRHPFAIDGRKEVLEIPNRRGETCLTLVKRDQDRPSGAALPGAVYELSTVSGEPVRTDSKYHYQKDGAVQQFVTGADGTFTITGLPWGSYYAQEIQAPDGYIRREEPLSFTFGKSCLKQEVTGWNLEKRASVRLTKRDAEDGHPLRDACYDLYRQQEDETWRKVKEYQRTNAAGELLVEELPFGSYEFRELQPPAGYQAASEPVSFLLDASTAEQTVEVSQTDERKTGSVQLFKKAEDGMPLAGAVYDLYLEGSPAPVRQALATGTDGRTPVVEGLAWGTYYLKETAAPAGYELNDTPVFFTVDAEQAGLCQSVEAVNLRVRGSVKLTKLDEATRTRPLAGAEFSLFRQDGTLVKDQLVTGEDGTLTVDGLDWGSYYFEEVKAPSGYGLSTEKVRFSVNSETCTLVQSLTCFDPAVRAQIKINKQISARQDAFGTPTFLFRISGEDVNHVHHQWIKSVTLANRLEGSVILSGIPAGTYTVEEIPVGRYKQSEVLPVKNVTVSGGRAEADLVLEPEAEVTFCNELEQYEKYSHTANATNLVTAVTRLTGIRAVYTGPEILSSDTESSYTFSEKDLSVTAYYDDGTQKELLFSDLFLDPETITGNHNTSGSGYTVEVSYRENGVLAKDSFSVEVALQKPWTPHRITYDANGGYFGADLSRTANQLLYLWDGSENLLQDGTYLEPEHLSRVFGGWYTDPACSPGSEYRFDPETELEQDLTVYAKWRVPEATLVSGSLLANMMKRLAGAQSPNIYTKDQAITAIRRAQVSPDPAQMTVEDAAIKGSETPVYFWFDQGTIYWWSKALHPKTSNLSYAFSYLAALTDLEGLTDWDVSETENMSRMFYACSSLTDLSALEGWDVSAATDLSGAFGSCSALTGTEGLKHWDVSAVTSMDGMFLECKRLENLSGLSGWNTASLTNINSMFRRCTNLVSLEPLKNWQVSGVTRLYQTFSECPSITSLLPLQRWDTGNMTSFQDAFASCKALTDTTGLENWNMSSATTLSKMFYLCQELSSVEALRKWDVSQVKDFSKMLESCHRITTLEPLSAWNTSHAVNMAYTFHACSGLTDLHGLEQWDVSGVTDMERMFADCHSRLNNLDAIRSWDVSSLTNMCGMFAASNKIPSLDALKTWNVGQVKDFSGAFRNCQGLNDASGIRDWKVSRDANFEQMFYGCPVHPSFTGMAGTWDSSGTFLPDVSGG